MYLPPEILILAGDTVNPVRNYGWKRMISAIVCFDVSIIGQDLARETEESLKGKVAPCA
jgi:hypothetical protein